MQGRGITNTCKYLGTDCGFVVHRKKDSALMSNNYRAHKMKAVEEEMEKKQQCKGNTNTRRDGGDIVLSLDVICAATERLRLAAVILSLQPGQTVLSRRIGNSGLLPFLVVLVLKNSLRVLDQG